MDKRTTKFANVMERPFYADTNLAPLYDYIIKRPAKKRVVAIRDFFAERAIVPPAKLLDAGCGTGEYSIGLAQQGFSIVGVDISPELLKQAKQKTVPPVPLLF